MKYSLIFVVFFLVSCQENNKAQEIQNQLVAINTKLEALQSENAALKKELQSLKVSMNIQEFMQSNRKIAYLTPGETGYSAFEFDLGVLTVSLTDIKPYANGSKVTLRMGNTLSSTINGLKGTFEWGPVDKSGYPSVEETKTKEIQFPQSLTAGSWTTISVVLEGVPPAEFGFLRLKNFSHTGIMLRQ